ncbi:hypothetical protein [Nonomuraea sp. CA-141351]|uniref:hypothetical protein n=1 Tax=Nonomuraea sp. CA-141351 TaxID=3239996 RepID=UPI003D93032B
MVTRALQVERNNHCRYLQGAFTNSRTYLLLKETLERDGYTIDPNLEIVRHQSDDVADTPDHTHQAAATDALTTAQHVGEAFDHGPVPQGHYDESCQFQVRRAANALVGQPVCVKLLDASSRSVYAWLTQAALAVAAEHDRTPAHWRGPQGGHASARSPLDGALARMAAAAWSRASWKLLAEIPHAVAPNSDIEIGDTPALDA